MAKLLSDVGVISINRNFFHFFQSGKESVVIFPKYLVKFSDCSGFV